MLSCNWNSAVHGSFSGRALPPNCSPERPKFRDRLTRPWAKHLLISDSLGTLARLVSCQASASGRGVDN